MNLYIILLHNISLGIILNVFNQIITVKDTYNLLHCDMIYESILSINDLAKHIKMIIHLIIL